METDPDYEFEAPKWFDFTADFEDELNDESKWVINFASKWVDVFDKPNTRLVQYSSRNKGNVSSFYCVEGKKEMQNIFEFIATVVYSKIHSFNLRVTTASSLNLVLLIHPTQCVG